MYREILQILRCPKCNEELALITEKDLLNKAAGVRTTANIWFENSAREKGENSNEANKYSETGELQITDYGISGIPVFADPAPAL